MPINKVRMVTLVAGIGAVLLAGALWQNPDASNKAESGPYSSEAQDVVERQLKSACGSVGGTLAGGQAGQKAFYEGDLTGDGEDDLILSHSGIRCANGQMNMRCGMEGCSLLIYRRQGAGLELSVELDALDFEVNVTTPVPTITILKKGGKTASLRWAGSSFN